MRKIIRHESARRTRILNYLSTGNGGSGGTRLNGVVLLVAVAGLLLLVPPASAQSAACNEIVETRSNASSEPGEQLTDVIGDRNDKIGRALDDARFEARLANARSDRERARIVAERVTRLEERLSTLDRCWQSHLTARENGNRSAELNTTQIDSLQQEARSLHQRVNGSRAVATDLPPSLRERYGIDAETFDTLEQRVGTLGQTVNQSEGSRAGPDS